MSAMAELELTRSAGDRRRYEVEGVGALRLAGAFSRRATAEAGGASWSFHGRGFWQQTIEAYDAAGTVVGSFDRRSWGRRGGRLRWNGRELELRPASVWKDRYALVEGERELAVLEGKDWGKRPVKIRVDDLGAAEPGLLLFATYLVRRFAEDTASTAAATT
jgi:hypothetical protein